MFDLANSIVRQKNLGSEFFIDPDKLVRVKTNRIEVAHADFAGLAMSGALDPEAEYVITGYPAGTLKAVKIYVRNVHGAFIRQRVDIETSWEPQLLNGLYDTMLNRLVYVEHGRSNIQVSGTDSLESFPWEEQNIVNVHLLSNAARLNAVNCFIDDLTIESGVVNVAAGSTLHETHVSKNATVNVNGATVKKGEVSRGTLNVNGGSLIGFDLKGISTATLNVGNHVDLYLTDSYVNQVGAGLIQGLYATKSAFTVGDVLHEQVTAVSTAINTTGSTGRIYDSTFENPAEVSLWGIGTLDIVATHITSFGWIRGVDADTFILYADELNSTGNLIVSPGKKGEIRWSSLTENASIRVNEGRFLANFSGVHTNANVSNNTTGTSTLDQSSVSNTSSLHFNGTSDLCQVRYSQVFSGAGVYFQGTSKNCILNHAVVCGGASYLSVVDSQNVNFNYDHVMAGARITTSSVGHATNTTTIQSCVASGYESQISFSNCSEAGSAYGIEANSTGRAIFQNLNFASWLFAFSLYAAGAYSVHEVSAAGVQVYGLTVLGSASYSTVHAASLVGAANKNF